MDTVSALLHAGANASAVDAEGKAVIHFAAENALCDGDTLRVLRMVLQGEGGNEGAVASAQDNEGDYIT